MSLTIKFSNFEQEKSDLVELIIQNFGLRPSNQNQNNQPGPSSRSFDDTVYPRDHSSSTSSSSSQNASRIASQNTSPRRAGSNQNSDNSNESTLGSEWEFVPTEQSASGNNSVNQTPTNEFNNEFVNLTVTNSGERNNPNTDNEPSQPVQNEAQPLDEPATRPDGDLMSNATAANADQPAGDDSANRSRLEANNLDSSRRTASTSRLHNANLNNLNANLSNNLSESTESLTNFKNFNISDCHSEEEIRNLSVRQLKLVLTRNYVNYKGCCEKEELQEKAVRLWNQIKQDKGGAFVPVEIKAFGVCIFLIDFFFSRGRNDKR